MKKNWTTNGGVFIIKSEPPITFKMPEFAPRNDVTWTFQIDENDSDHPYDMILGHNIQHVLGMYTIWSKESISWDEMAITVWSKLMNNIKEEHISICFLNHKMLA